MVQRVGNNESGRAVLAALRDLVPVRTLEFLEALRIAEL